MKFFGEPVKGTEVVIFVLFVAAIAMMIFTVTTDIKYTKAARAHPTFSVQCKGPITIERRRDFYEARCTDPQ